MLNYMSTFCKKIYNLLDALDFQCSFSVNLQWFSQEERIVYHHHLKKNVQGGIPQPLLCQALVFFTFSTLSLVFSQEPSLVQSSTSPFFSSDSFTAFCHHVPPPPQPVF